MSSEKHYRAFISYSQQDKAWGRRIHTWLEAYRVPVGTLADISLPKRLGRFFRDDEDMPAAADIAETVRTVLQESESLIVICSPRSAKSKWVNAEILHFRRTGRARKVFAVIIDGVPNSGDPATECFPPALRAAGNPDDPNDLPIEPMGLDVRKNPRARICARLAAGLLDVDFDDLWRRDERRRRKETVRNLAAAALVIVVAGAAYANRSSLTLWFDQYTLYRPFVQTGDSLARLAPGSTFQDCEPGSGNCPVMVVIPEGSFTMGAAEGEVGATANERPAHVVELSRFAAGKYAVTFDDWETCVKRGGCSTTPLPDDFGMGRGKRPVVGVSWHDASEYADWLSKMTGQTYRLLTEAEWEYAARAGSTTPWYWGGDFFIDEKTHAHCYICTWGGNVPQGTLPVGTYDPNAFNLHDMAGNVMEWVQDCYLSSYADDFRVASGNGAPPAEAACNAEMGSPGHGPGSGLARQPPRVLRGGSWRDGQLGVRSASRHNDDPRSQDSRYGFRVARSIAGQ